MPERGDPVSYRSARRMTMAIFSVLQSLARVLRSAQMILLALVFGDIVAMGGALLKFTGPVVVLEMRSVLIAGRHGQVRCTRRANTA